MRVVETSIQMARSKYATLRYGQRYTATTKNGTEITGRLANFNIDGNELQSVTLERGSQRILIRKEQIESIARSAAKYKED